MPLPGLMEGDGLTSGTSSLVEVLVGEEAVRGVEQTVQH